MVRLAIAAFVLVTSSGACAPPALTNETLELNSRHLRVTVDNRSSRSVAISFDSNTMMGNQVIQAGRVETVVFDPDPHRPAGRMLGRREAWALAWGNAVTDPAGSYIGMKGPLQQIAVSREPLEPTVSEILVVIGDADAGWRTSPGP